MLAQVCHPLLYPQVPTKETAPPIGAVESGQEQGRGEPGQTTGNSATEGRAGVSHQFQGLLVWSWRPSSFRQVKLVKWLRNLA